MFRTVCQFLHEHHRASLSPCQLHRRGSDLREVCAELDGPGHILAWKLLSPHEGFDSGPNHTRQQEQRCDQDVEEREGGEGHGGREVRFFEEAEVAHEGLQIKA